MCGLLRTRYSRIPTAATVVPNTSTQCRLTSAASWSNDLNVDSCSPGAVAAGATFERGVGAIQRCGSCESAILRMPAKLDNHARHRGKRREYATARPNHILHDAATTVDDYLVTGVHFHSGSAYLGPRKVEQR